MDGHQKRADYCYDYEVKVWMPGIRLIRLFGVYRAKSSSDFEKLSSDNQACVQAKSPAKSEVSGQEN